MQMGGFSIIEIGIWVIYFTILLQVLLIYKQGKTESYYRFFIPAFLLKVFGGVVFAIIYKFYYGYGDTFLYHEGAKILGKTLFDEPATYFRLLFSENANLPADLSYFSQDIQYSRGAQEWFMVKTLSPFSILSFHYYFVTTLFLSFISFFGAWKLFRVFIDLIPKYKHLAFIAAFCIPSVLIWGGGIMKDTMTLAGINIILYGSYFLLFKKQKHFLLWATLLFWGWIVYQLKAYILIAFIPALLFGLNGVIRDKIGSVFLRRIVSLALIFITSVAIYLGPIILRDLNANYSTSAITGKVKGFHSWHSDVGGSTYDLGVVEYSLTGVIQKIPASLNVTFFRPYPWEISNIVGLFTSFESLVLFGVFIYLLVKLRFRIIRILNAEPILILFTLYALIFGFVVGFTSYNFGALARYKIPVLSLFTFVLIYLYNELKTEKKN